MKEKYVTAVMLLCLPFLSCGMWRSTLPLTRMGLGTFSRSYVVSLQTLKIVDAARRVSEAQQEINEHNNNWPRYSCKCCEDEEKDAWLKVHKYLLQKKAAAEHELENLEAKTLL